MSTVQTLRPNPPKFRLRRKMPAKRLTVRKEQMRSVALRLARGAADHHDMLIAAALILSVMRKLPAHGEVRVTL